MKRSALPLVFGVYGLVRMCLRPNARHPSRKAKALPVADPLRERLADTARGEHADRVEAASAVEVVDLRRLAEEVTIVRSEALTCPSRSIQSPPTMPSVSIGGY